MPDNQVAQSMIHQNRSEGTHAIYSRPSTGILSTLEQADGGWQEPRTQFGTDEAARASVSR